MIRLMIPVRVRVLPMMTSSLAYGLWLMATGLWAMSLSLIFKVK